MASRIVDPALEQRLCDQEIRWHSRCEVEAQEVATEGHLEVPLVSDQQRLGLGAWVHHLPAESDMTS